MKKLEEISNLCYKNWDTNQGIIKAEPSVSRQLQYEPIRFLDLREISIQRYYGCLKNQKKEEELLREREKIQKIYKRWI
jgi:hypothetical protein